MGISVLAIDPGTSYTGWAYFKDNFPLEWGRVKADKNLKADDRSLWITGQIEELVEAFGPDKVICEMPLKAGPGAKSMNIVVLFRLVGMLNYMCHVRDVSFTFIEVGEWKGQIKKKIHHPILIDQIKKAYDINISGEPEDTIDAIGLGHWFVSKLV